MSEEIWKPIPGEPYYEASSLGRVRSLDRVVEHKNGVKVPRKGRVLKHKISSRGYHDVMLRRGPGTTHRVHKLVAMAFLGDKPGAEYMVCHKDDDKSNNRPENLYWGTHQQNMDDKVANGKTRNQYFYATHCKRGHKRCEENTYYRPSQPTVKVCKPCLDMRNKKAAKVSKERRLKNGAQI